MPTEKNLNYALQLQQMIRCKTISVKGSYDDTEFAKLRHVMEELFPTVHRQAKKLTFSEDCWIYEIPGKDRTRNLMLRSHHDVVAAEGDWEQDPFSGEIADGKIWGRGTVDTKTPLFAEFCALEELLKEGFVPPCNIWIGSSHNEELGGDGIPKALQYFKEQNIGFEVVLDEGGAVIEPPIGGMKCEKCAMIAVHEKGRYRLRCTTTDENGHAGLTAGTKATALERMTAFIQEASTQKCFIRRLNPQIRAMFSHLAPGCSLPMKLLFSNLWLFGGLLTKLLPALSPQAGGLLGTTISFTAIEKTPESKCCTATASLRPVDSADLKKDLDALRSMAAKHDVQITVDETSEYHEPADMTRPTFSYIKDCVREIFPAYPAAPFILPGGTDARTLTDICPCVLRFAPIKLSAQQLASVHGDNENIDVDALGDAVAFYKKFLRNYQ